MSPTQKFVVGLLLVFLFSATLSIINDHLENQQGISYDESAATETLEEVEAEPMIAEKIAERVLKATVTIIGYGYYGEIIGTGSGFFVGPRQIVTNYHVIESTSSLGFRLHDSNDTYRVDRIINTDPQNDLALLETSFSGDGHIRISDNRVSVGQPIYVAGAPMMLEGTFSTGIISALRSHRNGDWIQITAPISPGSSGGPVVNDRAELIGVTVATFEVGQNLNFAVPARYVRNLQQEAHSDDNRREDSSTRNIPESSASCGGVIYDIDGNGYQTVRIGNHCWMAENLRTTRYRDGTPIPNITDRTEWGSTYIGAWSYNDNYAGNNAQHGKLYNWYAVSNSSNICPSGWHVPTDNEWTLLSNFLGASAGYKMKSISGWGSNGNGSNESGFKGMPSGFRLNEGTFNYVASNGYFWSSTQNFTDTAWYRTLNLEDRDLFRSYNNKRSGFSVRCLRN